MTFRCQYKLICKAWFTKECADAGYDVAEVEVERLPTKMDFLTLEFQVSWHLFIDDVIKLSCIAIC